MADRHAEIDELAKKLGFAVGEDSHNELLETIAKSIHAGKPRIFECSRCQRKYRIPNARDNGIYRCVSCSVVIAEVSPTTVEIIDADKAEFILDEAIPAEVQNAMKDAQKIFGRFVLITQLGEGAMGTVWKAFDVELGRYVALKFIKSRRAEELRLEARMLAGLEHKNIARIYDIGNSKGTGFIAMQFVDGEPLSKVPMDQQKALNVMLAVCEAVEFAHKRGIVHRDLKPENVMIDTDGNVYVMDFGLATVKAEPGGDIAGTPGYMAPEVADGKSAAPVSDVYSLSATMYYLLSGWNPLQLKAGEKLYTVLGRIKSGEIIPIKTLLPDVSRELEAIVNKGLQKEVTLRYQSAGALAQDIRRFQMGYPVEAFGTGITYRTRKSILRNKVLAATVVVCSVIAAGAAIFGFLKWKEKREHEAQTNQIIDAFLDDLSKKSELAVQMRHDKASFAVLSKITRDAVDVYERVKEACACDARVHLALGRLHRMVGDDKRALEEIQATLVIEPSNGAAHYENAMLLNERYMKIIYDIQDKTNPHVMETRQKSKELGEEARTTRQQIKDCIGRAASNLPVESTERMVAEGLQAFIENQDADAEKLIRSALAKDPTNSDAVPVLVQIEFTRGNREGSVAILDSAIGKDRGNTSLLFTRGNLHFLAGMRLEYRGGDALPEYDKAIADFSSVIELHPNDDAGYFQRAVVKSSVGRVRLASGLDPVPFLEQALEDCNQALKVNSQDFGLWMIRGVFLNHLAMTRGERGEKVDELFERAISDEEQALKLRPYDFEVPDRAGGIYMNWGFYLMRTGRDPTEKFQKSLALFEKAIKMYPESAEAHSSRGNLYTMIGAFKSDAGKNPMEDYQKAISDFGMSIKTDSLNYQVWLTRSGAYLDKGLYESEHGTDPMPSYDRALSDCRESLKINPSAYESHKRLAAISKNIGDWKLRCHEDPVSCFEDAVKAYENALELNPNDPEVWMFLADTRGAILLCARQGWKTLDSDIEELYKKSLEGFSKALQLNSSYGEAYFRRACVHAAMNKFADALKDFEKGAQLNPNMVEPFKPYWERAKKGAANSDY